MQQHIIQLLRRILNMLGFQIQKCSHCVDGDYNIKICFHLSVADHSKTLWENMNPK